MSAPTYTFVADEKVGSAKSHFWRIWILERKRRRCNRLSWSVLALESSEEEKEGQMSPGQRSLQVKTDRTEENLLESQM